MRHGIRGITRGIRGIGIRHTGQRGTAFETWGAGSICRKTAPILDFRVRPEIANHH